VSAVAAPARPWVSHAAFSPASAVERGPSNGGVRIACPGQLQLVGDEGDVVLLACCDTCSFEAGVTAELVARQPDDEPEREERWWDR
jgi:hypothetical protein